MYAALSAVGRLDNCIAVCGHCGVMTDRCHDSRATWWWRGCSCWTWTSTGGPAERRRGWDNGVPAFHGPRGPRFPASEVAFWNVGRRTLRCRWAATASATCIAFVDSPLCTVLLGWTSAVTRGAVSLAQQETKTSKKNFVTQNLLDNRQVVQVIWATRPAPQKQLSHSLGRCRCSSWIVLGPPKLGLHGSPSLLQGPCR